MASLAPALAPPQQATTPPPQAPTPTQAPPTLQPSAQPAGAPDWSQGVVVRPAMPTADDWAKARPIPRGVDPTKVSTDETNKASVPWWRYGTRVGLPLGGIMAGAARGGVVGGEMGGPYGAAAGAVIGAGFGAFGGEAASLGVDAVTGAPPTAADVKERLASAPMTGAMTEMGGQALGAAGGVLLRGASRTYAPQIATMKSTLSESPVYGRLASFLQKVPVVGQLFPSSAVHATPAQMTQSRGAEIAENIVKNSLFGGQGYQTFVEGQAPLLETRARQLVAQAGGPVSDEDLGQLYQQVLGNNTDAFHRAGAKLYADVDARMAGQQVPTDDLRAFAAQELERRGAISSEVSGDTGRRVLQGLVARQGEETAEPGVEKYLGMPLADARARVAGGDAGMGKLLDSLQASGLVTPPLPDTLTFQQAQFLRSQLLARIRQAGAANDPMAGTYKQLVSRLSTAMDTAAAQVPGAQGAYQQANAFWKAGKETFESDFLRAMADAHPTKVADTLANPSTPVEQIRAAREASSPAAWRNVQASVVQRALDDGKGNLASGDEILTRLHQYQQAGFGTNTGNLQELFPHGEDQDLWEFGQMLQSLQKKGTGLGSLAIQFRQIGAATTAAAAVGGAVGGIHGGLSGAREGAEVGALGTAGTLLLGPRLLGAVLTSPGGRKWLTEGLTAPKGSATAIRAGSQILAFLTREGLLTHQGDNPVPAQATNAPTVQSSGRGGGAGPVGTTAAGPGPGAPSPIRGGASQAPAIR